MHNGEWFRNRRGRSYLVAWRAAFISFGLIGMSALPAGAQDQIPFGTLSVKSDRMTTEGKLFGCYLQFDAVVRDQTYRKGLPTYIGGSVGYTANGNMLLKLGLRDLGADFTPLQTTMPSTAFVETSNRANNADHLLARHESDDSSGALFLFNIDDVWFQSMTEISERKALTVVFNRTVGGSDVRLPLDLTVVSLDGLKPVHSGDQILDFQGCLAVLLPMIQSKLSGGTGATKSR